MWRGNNLFWVEKMLKRPTKRFGFHTLPKISEFNQGTNFFRVEKMLKRLTKRKGSRWIPRRFEKDTYNSRGTKGNVPSTEGSEKKRSKRFSPADRLPLSSCSLARHSHWKIILAVNCTREHDHDRSHRLSALKQVTATSKYVFSNMTQDEPTKMGRKYFFITLQLIFVTF